MDRLLVYGKGGFASGDVGFNTSVTSTGQPTTSSSDRENGWTAGAGFEYALSNCVTAGVEYDFVRLDVDDRNQFVFPGFVAPETVTNAHSDVQSVVGRLNFKVW
jgi:outer membrane immunogenic protein